MYLKKVCVNSFKSISYAEIELSPHFNCITGPNGVGKSNFLDAILFALTVPLKQLRVESLKDLITKSGSNFKRYSKSSTVTLTFCQREGDIQHVLSAKIIVDEQNDYVFYQIDNKNKKKHEVRRWLREVCNIIIGVDDNNDMNINFVIPQNIVTRIPFLSSANKWKFILDSAGTLDWERNKNNAYTEIKKCSLQLSLIQSNIDKLDQMLGKEKDLIAKLEYMKKIEHDIELLKQKLYDAKSFKISKKIEDSKQIIREIENEIETLEKRVDLTKSKLELIEVSLNEQSKNHQIQMDILNELQAQESELMNNIHFLKEKYNWKMKKSNEKENEFRNALAHKSKLEEEIRSLEVNSIVPLKSKYEAIIQKLSINENIYELDRDTLLNKINNLKDNIASLMCEYDDLERQLDKKEKINIENLSKLHQLELNSNLFNNIDYTTQCFKAILSDIESVEKKIMSLEKERISLESLKNRYRSYFFTFNKKIPNYLGVLCDTFKFKPGSEKYSKALSEILPINVLSVHITENIEGTHVLLEEIQKESKSSIRIWPLDRINYQNVENVKSKIHKNDIEHMVFPCDLISIKDEKFMKPIYHSPLSSWIIVEDKFVGEKLLKKYPKLKFITLDGKNKLSLGTLIGLNKKNSALSFTEIKIKLDILEKNLEELNDQKKVLINNKTRLEKYLALFKQYESLKQTLKTDEESINLLKNNLDEISKNINQKKTELELLNLQDERRSLEKEKTKIEKELSTLITRRETLQYELDDYKNTINEKFSIENIEENDDKIEEELLALEKELAKVNKDYSIKKEKVEEAEQLIYSLKTKIEIYYEKIRNDEQVLRKKKENIKSEKKILERLLAKRSPSKKVSVSIEDTHNLKYSLKQKESELDELIQQVFGFQSNKKISKVLSEKTSDLIILEEKLRQLEEFKYKTQLVHQEIEKLKEGIMSSKENIDKLNKMAKEKTNEILHGMCLNVFPSKHIEIVDVQDGIDFIIKERNSTISIESLSGGEKTLLALCFLLSTLLYQFLNENSSNCSKIMLLDEVDAALDEINCSRAYNLLYDYLISKGSQVISISHHPSFSKLAHKEIVFSKKQDTEFTTIEKVIIRRQIV